MLKFLKSELQYIVGFLIFSLSILILFIYKDNPNFISSTFIFISFLGSFLIVDKINLDLFNKSLVINFKKQPEQFAVFSISSIVFSLLLEIFGAWFTRLWFYPYTPTWYYFIICSFSFIVYCLLLYSLYIFFKSLFTNWKTSVIYTPQNFVYIIYLVSGTIGLIISLIYSIKLVLDKKIDIWNINLDSNYTVEGWLVFLASISGLFILEFLLSLSKKTTFTEKILNLSWDVILGIIFGTIFSIVLTEYVNFPFQIWEYHNWYLQDIALLKIPLLTYLSWPFHLIVLLDFLHLFVDRDSIEIW